MACKYWVKGQWLTETQFKKVLHEGLADQLVANFNFKIEDFNINPEYLEQLRQEISVEPVKLRIFRKSNKQVNNSRKVEKTEEGEIAGINKVWPRKNPRIVIETANKQIEKENKRLKINREKLPFILVTKIKGELKYGNAQTKDVKDIIEAAPVDVTAQMTEGRIYMLVPSAYGSYPILLRTNFLGQTKLAPNIKKFLKDIFNNKDAAKTKKLIKALEKIIQYTSITSKDGTVTLTKKRKNIENEEEIVSTDSFTELKPLIEHVIGTYNAAGDYIGKSEEEGGTTKGLIARVNHFNLNDFTEKASVSVPSNDYYADNRFITTDVFSEGGNFFNSSSFIIDAYRAEEANPERLKEVLDDDTEIKTKEKETAPETPPNQNTKKEENPLNAQTPEQLKKDLEIDIQELPYDEGTQIGKKGEGARVYVEIKEKGLEMTKGAIRRITIVNGFPRIHPTNPKFTEHEENLIRKSALPAFNKLKEKYKVQEETVPEGEETATAVLKAEEVAVLKETTESFDLTEIIKEIIANKEFIQLSPDGTHYINSKTGKKLLRVTSFITDEEFKDLIKKGENIEEYEVRLNKSKKYKPNEVKQKVLLASSQIIGTKIDELTRDFFNEKLKDYSEYDISSIEEITKFIEALSVIKEGMAKRGEMVLANDIVLYNDDLGIAGTVDLLTYDTEGNFRIYDMKTMRGYQLKDTHKSGVNAGKNKYEYSYKEEGVSNKEKHQKQLSLYRALLYNTHNVKAVTLGIMPIVVRYESGDITTKEITLKKGIPVEPLDTIEGTIEGEVEKAQIKEISEPTETKEDPLGAIGTIEDIINQGSKEDGQDLEGKISGKTRLTTKKKKGTQWNQDRSWLKNKIGVAALDGKIFTSLEELEKYLPEDTYSYLLQARKQGKFLHGIFTKAAVHLSEKAFEGTDYHEAFHVVFNLALPLALRIRLLNEAYQKFPTEIRNFVRREYGTRAKPTFLQIEEFLAEEFREYVQTNEALEITKSKEIANFFKTLFRGTKIFFSKNSKINIDSIFADIQLGVYKNRPKFQNTDLTKIDPEQVRLLETQIEYLDPAEEVEALHYFTDLYFKIIDAFREENMEYTSLSDPQIIARIGIRKTYGLLLNKIRGDILRNKGVKGIDKNIRIFSLLINGGKAVESQNIAGQDMLIFTEPTPLLKKFIRSLRQYKINITDPFERVENLTNELEEESSMNQNTEESTLEERWQKAYIEINPNDTLSQKVKRKTATISKIIRDKEGKEIVAHNMFGAPLYYDGKETFDYLGKNITDTFSPTELVEKLRKLEPNKKFISAILDFISKDPDFKTALYRTLASKTFQKFLMVQEKRGGKYINFYSNRQTIDSIIKETLIANFLIEDSPLFNKHTEGFLKGQTNFQSPVETKVTKDEKGNIIKLEGVIAEQLEILQKIKESADTTIDKKSAEKILQNLSDFFLKNNIILSKEQLYEIWNPGNKNRQTSWKNIMLLITRTQAVFNELAAGKNPFLELKAQEEVDNKVKSYKSILHQFTEAILPAMSKNLVLAFRNGNNKSVYSIQYSNYLNKQIAEFKSVEKLKKYLLEKEHDPLLSSMPIFKDLIDKNGNATRTMEELEIVIFDALAREGKRKSVEYEKLSDIELEATTLGAFHNNGSKKYAFYKLPIPSDSSTLPFIKTLKFSNEIIYDRITEIALGELKRISKLKNLPGNSQLRLIENLPKRGIIFQVLSFLNDVIDTENYSEQIVKEAIIEFLNGDFLEMHKEGYRKRGIIKSYESGAPGLITFAEKVITIEQKTTSIKQTEFFKNYLFNQFLMNTQMTTIFGGDPSFYADTTEYQKRYKQVISPGDLTNHEIVDSTYDNLIFNDDFVPTPKERVYSLIKAVNNSDLSPQKKKELISNWEAKGNIKGNKEDLNNITDAATYVHIRRMVQILDAAGQLSPEQEEAAVRIEKGEERPEDAALFGVFKPFVFAKIMVEGLEVPIQIKNSEMLLTKAFAERRWKKGEEGPEGEFKYPKLVAAYDILDKGIDGREIASIIFKSAVKEGGIGNFLNEKGDPIFSELTEQPDGTYKLGKNTNILTLKQEDWRNQQENPEHYIDEAGNFGTQLRQLMRADLDMTGEYNVGGKKYSGKEIATMYQNLIVSNIIDSYEKVAEMFFTEESKDKPLSKQEIDYSKLIKYLEREITERGYGEEYFTAIAPIKEILKGKETGKIVPTLPFWHPAITYKVETLLHSFFKNNITKQTINGGNMVNATSYGVSHTLKAYWDKNGNYEVEALLPWWSKRFFPLNEQGEVDLNEIPEKLRKVIGYRIPTEDKYSIFNIKVVGFTDSAAGGAIILPAEATFIAGLDFDIDKLFMILPSFKLNMDGKPEYIEYLDKDSNLIDVADAIVSENKYFNNFVENYVKGNEEVKQEWKDYKAAIDDNIFKKMQEQKDFKLSSDFRAKMRERDRLKKQLAKTENLKEKQAIKALLPEFQELIQEEETFTAGIAIAHSQTQKLRQKIADYFEDNYKKEDIDFEIFNNITTRNNKLLEITIGIMESKNTLLSVLDVGNFDSLKELANKTRLLQINLKESSEELKTIRKEANAVINKYNANKISLEEYRKALNNLTKQLDNSKDFNINYPLTQLSLFRVNMTGKELIGIFANHNTHHAKAQFTSLETGQPVLFNEEAYSLLNQIYYITKDGFKKRISKSLAVKLAAVVDNSKFPVSSYLNMNTYTGDLIAYLSRLGVDEETIFAFVNQPVILNVTANHFNEKGSLKEQKESLEILKKVWRTRIEAKVTKEALEYDSILDDNTNAIFNLNLKDLQNALDENGSDEYYITQYKVLTTFETYLKAAEELKMGVQATRIDTKAVGPTNGDTYAMINKQEKLLEKDESKRIILGIKEMLFDMAEEKINPAFYRYAWLNPITIMNKIFPSIGSVNLNGEIEYSVLGLIKNFFSNLKDQSYTITEQEARKIDSHFMTYLASAFPFFKYNQIEDALLKIPEELQKYKRENLDSPFINFLEQLNVVDADKYTPVKRILFYNTGKESIENEKATRLWEMMLESEDPATKQLALNLVKYTYFSNGFAFGPYTFFNLIPVKFWTNSFARSSENKDTGLLTKDGRTFTELLTSALEEVKIPKSEEGNEERSSTFTLEGSSIVQNFLKQFAQNTAEKGMIIKTLVATDASDREYSPNMVQNLKEDEVYVFGTNDFGIHNYGSAGYAFRKNAKHVNDLLKNGEKGHWAVYGETSQISKGKEGRSFGVRTHIVDIVDNKVEVIKKEDMSPQQKINVLKNIKEDFLKIKKIAEENPKMRFIVDGNLLKSSGWEAADLKTILVKIAVELGFPDNIILPKFLGKKRFEFRDFEPGKPNIFEKDGKQILTLWRKSNAYLKDNKGRFPSFVKIIGKGKTKGKSSTKLFVLLQRDKFESQKEKEDENKTEQYRQIPLLGLNQYVLEYDFDKTLEESILPKVKKGLASAKSGKEAEAIVNALKKRSTLFEEEADKREAEESALKETGQEQESTQPQAKVINIYAGTNENAELSNFAPRQFKYKGLDYVSVEEAFQIAKKDYFNTSSIDPSDTTTTPEMLQAVVDKWVQDIFNAKSSAAKKKIGGKSIGVDFETYSWDQDSSNIMKDIIKESFTQDSNARAKLLATGNATLTHTQADKPKGKGPNWGKEFPRILMEVRETLKKLQPTTQPQAEKTTDALGLGTDQLTPQQMAMMNAAAMGSMEDTASTTNPAKETEYIPATKMTSYSDLKKFAAKYNKNIGGMTANIWDSLTIEAQNEYMEDLKNC